MFFPQIISQVGTTQRLPELAHSSLVPGSCAESFFTEMCTSTTKRCVLAFLLFCEGIVISGASPRAKDFLALVPSSLMH